MRGISITAFILVFLIFICLELISYAALLSLFSKTNKSLKIKFSLFYWLLSAAILFLFFYTFSDQERLRSATNYSFFNMVLVITFINTVIKLIISLFTIVSVILAFFSKNKARILLSAGLILASGMMLIMVYSVLFGKKQVRIERISLTIDSLPSQLEGFSIVQLSDVHLGSMNGNKDLLNKAKDIIEKLEPDLLLFTGDMVNNFDVETGGYVDLFKGITAPYGKFAITGNHDYGDYYQWKTKEERTFNLSSIRDSIRKMGFDLLLNENRRIEIKDTSFYLIGVENWGHPPFPQYAELYKAIQGVPPHVFSVLMSHDPAHWDAQVVPQTDIPLTLSGHTHGLQFGIRIAGIEFSPMYFIQKYWAGLYSKEGQYLYVNRGLGTIGFAGRVEMKPEISLITLHAKL